MNYSSASKSESSVVFHNRRVVFRTILLCLIVKNAKYAFWFIDVINTDAHVSVLRWSRMRDKSTKSDLFTIYPSKEVVICRGCSIIQLNDKRRMRINERLFGNTGACSACGQMIPASEFVMRSGGPSPQTGAPPHVFHLKCFVCSKCGAPLVQGDRYYMLSGSLVCEQDWHKLLKNSAATPTIRKGKVGRPRRSRD